MTGSEKAEFFADPEVVQALAAKGLTVRTETSGSWDMEQLPLKGYDFAFPSDKAPADGIKAKTKVTAAPLRPFCSPLVVVAHSAAARCSRTTGSPPSAPAATPAEPPERHLERQLGALYEEAAAIADALREAEARRQETHTRYLEDRGR